MSEQINLRRYRRLERRAVATFGVASTSARVNPHEFLSAGAECQRQWEREVNEINGIAFAGMPGSFPGRNEGEPFHVRCGLNLSFLLLAPEPPPGAARLLVYTASRACGSMYQWEWSVASSHKRHLWDEQRRISLNLWLIYIYIS